MRIYVSILLLALAVPAAAAPLSSTLYLDGARYTTRVSAVKGVAELVLPAGIQKGSLRVRPASGVQVQRVVVAPARPDKRTARELDRIGERRELLQARLKALQTREEIFRAAARTQSGKAPRKTRANPDPLVSIRQGTEFAIAQLEEVYRLRRRTEKEMASLDDRLEVLRKDPSAGGNLVRVWLAAPKGEVAISWSVAGSGWKPHYDIRCDGSGTAQVTLRAGLPPGTDGPVAVVLAKMGDVGADQASPVKGEGGVVATFPLPVSQERTATFPMTALVATVVDATGKPLPAGAADGYWRGEYLGTVPFPEVAPGGTVTLRYGAPPGDTK